MVVVRSRFGQDVDEDSRMAQPVEHGRGEQTAIQAVRLALAQNVDHAAVAFPGRILDGIQEQRDLIRRIQSIHHLLFGWRKQGIELGEEYIIHGQDHPIILPVTDRSGWWDDDEGKRRSIPVCRHSGRVRHLHAAAHPTRSDPPGR